MCYHFFFFKESKFIIIMVMRWFYDSARPPDWYVGYLRWSFRLSEMVVHFFSSKLLHCSSDHHFELCVQILCSKVTVIHVYAVRLYTAVITPISVNRSCFPSFVSFCQKKKKKSGKSHWIDPNVFCYVVCCMWKNMWNRNIILKKWKKIVSDLWKCRSVCAFF